MKNSPREAYFFALCAGHVACGNLQSILIVPILLNRSKLNLWITGWNNLYGRSCFLKWNRNIENTTLCGSILLSPPPRSSMVEQLAFNQLMGVRFPPGGLLGINLVLDRRHSPEYFGLMGGSIHGLPTNFWVKIACNYAGYFAFWYERWRDSNSWQAG